MFMATATKKPVKYCDKHEYEVRICQGAASTTGRWLMPGRPCGQTTVPWIIPEIARELLPTFQLSNLPDDGL
jgi:hypothetical protein